MAYNYEPTRGKQARLVYNIHKKRKREWRSTFVDVGGQLSNPSIIIIMLRNDDDSLND